VKTTYDRIMGRVDLLVRNQKFVAEGLMNGQAIPVGNRARRAGFQIGVPLGRPLPFAMIPVIVPGR
jgi:hypothetical protein